MKFVVTEADGTFKHKSAFRYHSVASQQSSSKVTNPCDDYEYLDTSAIGYSIRSGSSKPPSVSSKGVLYHVNEAVMPDLLFCQFELHDEHKKIYRSLKNDVYGSGRNSRRGVLPSPLQKRPKWVDEVYWSARNSPVWKSKVLPCVFNW